MKVSKNFVAVNKYRDTYSSYIGQKFGKLTILDFPGGLTRADNSRSARVAVHVKCECGNEVITEFKSIKNNHTTSCGCIHALYKRGEEGAFSNLMSHTKNSAKNREINFDLAFEDFYKLVKSNCHYCGVEPRQIKNSKNSKTKQIVHNGLDRIDSNKGYVLDNVVPCCKTCNFAKNALKLEEFNEWIQRIAKYQNDKGLLTSQTFQKEKEETILE